MRSGIGEQMNKATVSQWGKLYDIALDIKELRPWSKLKDTDIIAVTSPMSEETYYFSFMGINRERYGISCFIGRRGLDGFFSLRDSGYNLQSELLCEQYSMIAYFGTQADITEEDAALIRDLKLYFPEDRDWLYFRSFEPGYVPWPLSLEEVLLLTDLFGELYAALRGLFADAPEIDFSKQILLRRPCAESGGWVSETAPIPERRKEYQSIKLTDELLMARLMKRPLVDAKLEFDIFYIMMPLDDKEYKKPFFPMMALLVDSPTGSLIEFEIFTPKDDENEHVIALLLGFIEKHGRPLTICLQNPRLKAALELFCRSTAISLEMVNFLPSINAFKLEKGISQSVDEGE